jgi:hypothetical protein
MLCPLSVSLKSGRQVNSTIGVTMSIIETVVETLTRPSLATRLIVKGPACTQVFIYATVTLTIPVASQVIVKLPLDED